MLSPPMRSPSMADIFQRMADALPTHAKEDDSSDLASSYEAIALLAHAYLSTLDFKLCGFDEEKPLPECESLAPRMPPQWNSGFGSLSFVYSHAQPSSRFVIRVDRMGAKVEVRGLAVGQDRIHRFDRNVREVVSASHLPVRITLDSNGEEDRSDLADKLSAIFLSKEAVSAFIMDLQTKIVQNLFTEPQKDDGIEADDAEAEISAIAERRAQEAQDPNRPVGRKPRSSIPSLHSDPVPGIEPYQPMKPVLPPAHPRPGAPVADFPPPGFEDEHEMNRPPRGPIIPDGRSPFNIGHDDLNPPGLGPHDPLRGSFVPGGIPQPGFSGMHPTFDDPLFALQGGDRPNPEGYDPQVPPGARWDPIGPGGGPRMGGPGSGSGRGPYGQFGDGGGYGGGGFGGGGHII